MNKSIWTSIVVPLALVATFALGVLPGCDSANTNQNEDTTMKTNATTAQAGADAAACAVGPDGAAACGTTHWKGKTEEEWRKTLTPEQYRVARQAGTERAFSGKYWDTKTKGTYQCAACALPLFSSETKFDSGTGWPSFWQPLKASAVATHSDVSHGMTRTEAKCGQCDAHLGHVFDDGPPPTGQRYCMNSAVLNLVPAEGAETTAAAKK